MGAMVAVLATAFAVLLCTPVMLYFAPRWVKRPLVLWVLRSFSQGAPPEEPERSDYAKGVLPHGQLEELVEGKAWALCGSLPQPGPSFGRNMTVFKRKDGKLIVHSCVCLASETKARLDARGPVGVIVVPNSFHRLDAPRYKAAYPEARVVCPSSARAKVEEWCPVDATCEEEFAQCEEVEVLTPPNSVDGELTYIMGGSLVVCCDLFFNIDPCKADAFQRFFGIANGFGVSGMGKVVHPDLPLLRRWVQTALLDRAANFEAVVVGHGDLVKGSSAVRAALQKTVDSLV
ncbi:unnamed protein product [Effrenium voratum]|uniref:Uncharacterized protein n=1 Tax=Effrenium voratum TaxID=2562239 RepID=A0AA36JFY3_9DINO|nr:unnamed protein product [Effrenium voratum]CAJ1460401.1 unnamed protein product [Effrenium voratum]